MASGSGERVKSKGKGKSAAEGGGGGRGAGTCTRRRRPTARTPALRHEPRAMTRPGGQRGDALAREPVSTPRDRIPRELTRGTGGWGRADMYTAPSSHNRKKWRSPISGRPGTGRGVSRPWRYPRPLSCGHESAPPPPGQPHRRGSRRAEPSTAPGGRWWRRDPEDPTRRGKPSRRGGGDTHRGGEAHAHEPQHATASVRRGKRGRGHEFRAREYPGTLMGAR